MTKIGAAVTVKTGQGWTDAIEEFEDLTERAMDIRRCYDGAPFGDIDLSNAHHDLGLRPSLLSIKPTITTSLATLESLAQSILDAEHETDVIIYHEPVDNMTGPNFKALYLRSAEPLRAAGIPVGVCYTNWSCNLPWSNTQSALKHYWPGDEVVDFIGIDEYPVNEITSTKDAIPMDVRADEVSQFADSRGIPLGLAEYGVDGAWDVVKTERWLRGVTDWASARKAAGTPLRWMCYFSSDVGGNYWIDNKPENLDVYKQMAEILG